MRIFFASFLFFICIGTVSRSQNVNLVFSGLPDGLNERDEFGYAVAVSGNYAIASAPGNDEAGPNNGVVYVFEKVNGSWNQVAKLMPSPSSLNNYGFGFSIDIYDDIIVVGNPSYNTIGLVYIYKKPEAGWKDDSNPTLLFKNSKGINYERFGNSVSINKDMLLIGTNHQNPSDPNRGFVYKIIGDSIVLKQEIREEDYPNTEFANSYEIFEDIIGISGNNDESYIFKILNPEFGLYEYDTTFVINNNWLAAADISLGNDIIALSSLAKPTAGVAKTYRTSTNGWQSGTTYAESEPDNSGTFGFSVSLSGDYLICNNYRDDVSGMDVGSVSLFNIPVQSSASTNIELHKILSPVQEADLFFGRVNDISGNNIIIGSSRENNSFGLKAGAIYIYEIDQPYVINIITNKPTNISVGDTVQFSIEFNEPIDLVGTPQLEIFSYNQNLTSAQFINISNNQNFNFEYVFKDGDSPYYIFPKNVESFLEGGSITRRNSSIPANRVLPPIKINNLVDYDPPTLLDSSFVTIGDSTLLHVILESSKEIRELNIDSIDVTNGTLLDITFVNSSISGTVLAFDTNPINLVYNAGTIKDSLQLNNRKIQAIYYTKRATPSLTVAEDFYEGRGTFRLEFDQEVIDFNIYDSEISNAEILSFTEGGGVYEVILVANSFGPVTIKIPENICYSQGSLLNNSSEILTMIYHDLAYPILTDSSYVENKELNLYLSSTKLIGSINMDSIIVENGTLQDVYFQGFNLFATILPISNDSVDVYYKVGAVADSLDIPSEELSLTYYLAQPFPEISVITEFKNAKALMLIKFNQPVFDFLEDDIVLSNASIVSFTGSGIKYEVEIEAIDYGSVSIEVPANRCYSRGQLKNLSSEIYELMYSHPSPYTFSLTTTTPFNIDKVNITCHITFSHPTKNLTAESFYLTNAIIEKIVPIETDLSYEIFMRAIEEGVVEISLNGAKTKDIYENPSIDKDPLVFIYDKSAPFIETFNPAPVNYLEDIIVEFSFNEPVFDFFVDPIGCVLFPEECFNMDDIIITGTSASSFKGKMGSYVLGLKPSYITDISVTFPSGIAYDIAGKMNLETQVFTIRNKFGVVTSAGTDEIFEEFIVEQERNRLIVKTNSISKGKLALFDSRGMVIFLNDNDKNEVIFDLSGLSYGVYVLVLTSDNMAQTKKILINKK